MSSHWAARFCIHKTDASYPKVYVPSILAMSKQSETTKIRKISVSDGLDQVADLASAVANSVHEKGQDFGHRTAQTISNFPEYHSPQLARPVSPFNYPKSSLPISFNKDSILKRDNLLSFGDVENAISPRRLGFSENSPLLPLHNVPGPPGIHVGQRSTVNNRVARFAAGSAILVSVLLLTGLWLSEEIMVAWRTVSSI
ncbi:hypothetical protein JCM33374_g2106 [Metschnikowia sp. JCM 33374]|nr:hypothetical protein JCM33374_g2106 [Metschnikowia sp. JCM 33374]